MSKKKARHLKETLTVMAHYHRAGIGVAGAGFGALPVAVIIVGAHTSVALQSLA